MSLVVSSPPVREIHIFFSFLNHGRVAILSTTSLDTRTNERRLLLERFLLIQRSFPIHRITFAITFPKCFVLFLHELIPKLLDQRLDNEAANVHLDHLKNEDSVTSQIFLREHT